jgi:hypothetical protein
MRKHSLVSESATGSMVNSLVLQSYFLEGTALFCEANTTVHEKS